MLRFRNFDKVVEAETISKNAFSTRKRKNRINLFILCVVIPIIFGSCSTAKIYTKHDAMSYAMKHKTVAMLPPKVQLEPNKGESLESKNEREQDLIRQAQITMFHNFYKFGKKYGIYLEVQDIEATNRILAEIGCPMGNCNFSPEELANKLGVDAFFMANGNLERIYARNVGYGIVYAIIFFPYGTPVGIMLACQKTGLGTIDLKLYDGKSGTLLYDYSDKYSFTYNQQDDIFMMKRMIEKSPYRVK